MQPLIMRELRVGVVSTAMVCLSDDGMTVLKFGLTFDLKRCNGYAMISLVVFNWLRMEPKVAPDGGRDRL